MPPGAAAGPIAAARAAAWAPTLRYLPPGYLPFVGSLAHPAVPADGRSGRLVFLGWVHRSTGRVECWRSLQEAFGGRLLHNNSVWSGSALDELLRAHDVHLSLHRGCALGETPVGEAPVAAFRLSTLLSAGKRVLSQRGNAADEAEYAGIVRFAALSQMVASYEAVLREGREERLRASRAFRSRFAPQRLMARAGVYRDWGIRHLRDPVVN